MDTKTKIIQISYNLEKMFPTEGDAGRGFACWFLSLTIGWICIAMYIALVSILFINLMFEEGSAKLVQLMKNDSFPILVRAIICLTCSWIFLIQLACDFAIALAVFWMIFIFNVFCYICSLGAADIRAGIFCLK